MVGCGGRDKEGVKGDVCCMGGVTFGDDDGIFGVDVFFGDVGGRVLEEWWGVDVLLSFVLVMLVILGMFKVS